MTSQAIAPLVRRHLTFGVFPLAAGPMFAQGASSDGGCFPVCPRHVCSDALYAGADQ